jgi:hypothetical protein
VTLDGFIGFRFNLRNDFFGLGTFLLILGIVGMVQMFLRKVNSKKKILIK